MSLTLGLFIVFVIYFYNLTTSNCSEPFHFINSIREETSEVSNANFKFITHEEGSEDAKKFQSKDAFASGQTGGINNYRSDESMIWKDLKENVEEEFQRMSAIIPARIEDYPYTITLSQLNLVICGGSLITLSHVLTAAHCVSRRMRGKEVRTIHPSMFLVRAGSNCSSQGGYTRRIKTIQIHPKWKTRFFDLAILTLKEPFLSSLSVDIIKLASDQETRRLQEMTRTGVSCVVAGWGDTEPRKRELATARESFRRSEELVAFEVPLISWSSCKKIRFIKEEAELCSGHSKTVGPCQRGSGGPLVCDNIQFGVITRGRGCIRESEPDIYSRIDTSYSFIHDSINSSLFDPFYRMDNNLNTKTHDYYHKSFGISMFPLGVSHFLLHAFTIIISILMNIY